MHRALAAVLLLTALVPTAAAPATATAAPPCPTPVSAEITATSGAETPWAQLRLAPERAWPATRGRGVTVAVIDSGVDPAVPALAGRVEPGSDFVQPGAPNTCDVDGHGTVIAGIIAGGRQAGFSGVAPEAHIRPARVVGADGKVSSQTVAQAVSWAAAQPDVRVINLSLQLGARDDGLAAAIADAVHHHDIVVVAAAGNVTAQSPQGSQSWPAAYPDVLAVGATDPTDRVAALSLAGPNVGLTAPGTYVVGPLAGTADLGQAVAGGTSYSAAYVSGSVALIRSLRPDLSAADVIALLERTADKPKGGRTAATGFGIVNPYRAVESLAPQSAATAPDAASGRTDPIAWVGPAGAAAVLGMVAFAQLARVRREPEGP